MTTLPKLLFQRQTLAPIWIVLITFGLRLFFIHNQPTDWHAFRQADTASVTREYIKHGIDLLHPRYQDLSNIQSGKENLEGYRMVEFPIINAVVALLVRTWPQLDFILVSRLVSVAFSCGTAIYLLLIGKRWSSFAVGYWAAIIWAILPYSVFYGRVILPEPGLLFFGVGSIYWFQRWLDDKSFVSYSLSLTSLILAFLLKPFVAFYGPVFVVMVLIRLLKSSKTFLFHPLLWLYPVLAVLPVWVWREWILQFPSGIPASDWLFNSNHIRLRPAWWRWLGYERLTKLILGWVGVPIMGVGLLDKWLSKEWWLYISWAGGIGAYLVIIATGNVQHDYYQVLTLPIICLLIGRGLVALHRWTQRAIPALATPLRWGILLVILLSLSWGLAWQNVRGFFRTRPDWELAGRVVDQLTPSDAKVIAPAFGDTAFLFQTNRTGWPIGFNIDDKIAFGAQYYISTAYDDEARELEKKYQVIAKTPEYILIKF